MDLNLLVALDALLEENSVQGAADRLRLSAPAMSRALGRIRRATGDDILVRSGRTMTPTPRALELREETSDLVRRATALLAPAREVDLADVNRTFVVRCHDALLGTLAPGLLGVVAESMPQATVRFVGETADDGLDLQRGYVDLDIGASPPPVPEVSSKVIGRDRLVAAMRPDNPLALESMTANLFVSARHVIVSRRGRTRDAIDTVLNEFGTERRVYAVVPTSTAALEIVAESNAVAVVAGGACAAAMRQLGIVGRDLPFELPGTPAIMLWHRRNDSDLIHAWFRDKAEGVLSAALV
ncbi:LysR family transcriptional regulator [Rhodococcus sp. ACPA4]|uniref:LysR family transcriptional regulator n=1 Tax=Rhodococcus sp. ACPA4 TaxID=2028571 RepID=UPI001C5325FB|nr:LysR family transcriptional regulator [Rhodococcus sp. ACPA4]